MSRRVLRCVTLNLWGMQEPLAARMAALGKGIVFLAPDVVALQEVREVPGQLENQAAVLARALGMNHVFAPATPFGGGHEGVAILARAPIGQSAIVELPHAQLPERRVLLCARVDTPMGGVWIHTTHLNYRLQHGKQREDQVQAIGAAIAMRTTDAPQILMGDFNATPDSDEIRWLRGLTTLAGARTYFQDAWERLHPGEPGWTWAAANDFTSKLKFLNPNRRIDYIFVTAERGDGRGAIRDCRIVFDRPTADGVWVSDHFGLLAEVQIEAEK